ncbi:phosphate ABC transporter substrate-binding protein [Flammeovirga yaeyamensis]|uniref:Phosphate-binding protein n=1 Tax=Flammeovirga yaeyamensis TaxID=367791 RepID=A0AAX1MZ63_9BACT|nr:MULTISPECIES: phosphate ABC transporter substrate-binding protein [Flammeovirga]ANQ47968.1 phosphate ABC transporter substrate-binding protein [Flammeovirga sp. MY04]MBB3700870.1 phosphate transport system substrate-binding protein [Flammeovirga yaeyamensis]NMF37978.1 phosphate ABC transporter substrate-binding protein [Flammeovirga yaeyamensis]QWG00629.1 phosphate ABC transporter substrate-binding protein [Flammeovirga yaeyamensis]
MNISTKGLTFITLFSIVIFGKQLSAQEILNTKGSDTMLPLVTALANNYDNSNEPVEVVGGGSSLGFKGLKSFETELALSSRKVKSTEKTNIEENIDQLIEKVIAYDALSIITHPSNSVTKLTLTQLIKIYKGQITNWSQLGGENLPITVISRDKNSGSYGFMTSVVVKSDELPEDYIEVHSNAGVVENVSKIKGAIGYCGIAYVEEVVQPLSISEKGGNYVYPSFRNALSKTYPLSRPLYFYYRISDKSKVTSFVSFALSDKGQQIIAHKGYIPVF